MTGTGHTPLHHPHPFSNWHAVLCGVAMRDGWVASRRKLRGLRLFCPRNLRKHVPARLHTESCSLQCPQMSLRATAFMVSVNSADKAPFMALCSFIRMVVSFSTDAPPGRLLFIVASSRNRRNSLHEGLGTSSSLLLLSAPLFVACTMTGD